MAAISYYSSQLDAQQAQAILASALLEKNMNILRSLSLLLPLLHVPALGATEVMRLASLEWLPYVGAGLPQHGLSAVIAATAAKQMDHKVRIDYFPWLRAMQVGGEDPGFSGYFPAYYTTERAKKCHFSKKMGTSTLGLAYLKQKPMQWQSLSQLTGLTFGVVFGYSNGEEFDALVKQGTLKVDTSPSDALNIRKLLASRVSAIAIDKAVLRYLLLTDPDFIKQREKIVLDDHVLAELTLHVCFQRTPRGQVMQQAFDASLKAIDAHTIENEFFQELESKILPVSGK